MAPTEDELKQLLEDFPLAEDYVNYPLDMDEKARIEKDDDAFLCL